MSKSRQEDTIKHDRSDECYVDEWTRRCPRCSEPKQLHAFRPEDGKPRVSSDITPLCNVCREAIRIEGSVEQRELKKVAAIERSADAVQSLGAMLNNVGKRRVIEEACPSLVDGVRAVMRHLGGEDEFWKLSTTALKECLQSEKHDIKIKAVSTAFGFVRDGNKMQGDPVDFNDVDDDQLMQLLFEPAKRLLMSSAEFRAELLNDPEVRRMFLSDLNVEVLDVSGEVPE